MDTSNTEPRMPAKSGDEQDVVTGWRKYYTWTQRPGATSKTKRAIRRRERRAAKHTTKESDQ